MRRDYQTGRRLNPVERLMFSAAAKDDRCAAAVAEFGHRRVPVHRFLSPGALARAARVNLTRRAGTGSGTGMPAAVTHRGSSDDALPPLDGRGSGTITAAPEREPVLFVGSRRVR